MDFKFKAIYIAKKFLNAILKKIACKRKFSVRMIFFVVLATLKLMKHENFGGFSVD